MPHYSGTRSAKFTDSPAVGDARSYSYDWASRYGPTNDGSCNENVAVMVLESFGIPIVGSHPPRGNLCMCDINNMSAIDAINLSLLENAANREFIECYMNADGFAYFQEVYPNPPSVSLDIRMCVPTSSIEQRADLVIVRGYKKPPVREFKAWEELDWDAEIECLNDFVQTSCTYFVTEAWRSYKDPILETSYMDGVDNLYDIQAFESLVGYAIRFNGDTDLNIKYSFNNSTLKNVPITLGTAINGSQIAGCNDITGGLETVNFSGWSTSLDRYMGTDRYGDPWPLFMSVQAVYMYGYAVKDFGTMPGSSDMAGYHPFSGGTTTWVHLEDKPKLVTLPTTNWHWDLESDGTPLLKIYYSYDTSFTGLGSDSWIASTLTDGASDIVVAVGGDSTNGGGSIVQGVSIIPLINGSMGFGALKIFAVVEIDRPSVHVNSPYGNAKTLLTTLEIAYQPIIVTDEPEPVAYTFGGSATLVDHTLDLYDSDPATLQTPPSLLEGSLSWLQTQTNGTTIDVALPFADENDCLALAETMFELQNEEINSYNIVCGPDDEPLLGAKVEGYEGRINSITYSYQDGQSYNINVNIGSTFMGLRGGGGGLWYKKAENVTRDGKIVWVSGNSIDYRVFVQGFGVVNAINMCLDNHCVGDVVSISIYNTLQDR